jgi:hypothetical protein
MKNLELSDAETATLIDLLKHAIVTDRYALWPRVQTLEAILTSCAPSRSAAPTAAEGISSASLARDTVRMFNVSRHQGRFETEHLRGSERVREIACSYNIGQSAISRPTA